VIAERFNNRYGPTFVVPSVCSRRSRRVMTCKNHAKMSKSISSPWVNLRDDSPRDRQEIKKAVTDTDTTSASTGEEARRLEPLEIYSSFRTRPQVVASVTPLRGLEG